MLLDVEHHMRFLYSGFIRESHMELRVRPAESRNQTLRSFSLAVGPPTRVGRYLDWNRNVVHRFGITDYHDRIEVVAHSVVDVRGQHPDPGGLVNPRPDVPGRLLDFTAFGGPVLRSEALVKLHDDVAVGPDAPLGEQILAIGTLIRDRFRYEPGVTTYQSDVDHVIELGRGVCQDFAHLMLALLRMRGIACRYVSGCLHVEGDEPAQSHAWLEVFAGDDVWASFDPTHGAVPDDRYVAVARGRHYEDVPPNRGVFRGRAEERLETEVHTKATQWSDVAGLQERTSDLEVPVYRELPASRRTQVPGAEAQSDDAGPPLQQQQQQQQGDPAASSFGP